MELETERLIIRPVSENDKEEIFKYRSDKEINKYQGWIPETVGDVENFIARISRQIDIPETWFQFVLVDRRLQKIIGDIGTHFLDEKNCQVEIGCTLNKDFQNMGFATEALKRVIDYLFKDLKKHRIIASIDPGNESSIRLVERLGFRKEAHFVESVFLNGEWIDDIVYALLEKEWNNN